MKKRTLVILLHCVAWFAFLLMPYLFNPDHYQKLGSAPSEVSFGLDKKSQSNSVPNGREATIEDILLPPQLANGFLLIVIFYANYLFVMPRYYRKRKYWLPVLSLAGSVALLFLVNALMGPEYFGNKNTAFTIPGGSHNLFMFIIVIVFSFLLTAYEHMRRIEKERLYNEILFLKAQVNPHFLFNTLNSIYSLSLTRSERAPDAIVKLSSLFRYYVTEAGKGFVSLEKELKYISDYIELQRLRLSDKVHLKYEVTGDPLNYEITPFALIPFIENAFKYGVNSQENSSIDVFIAIKNGELEMQVSNNKVYIEKDASINSGLSIDNTVRRLQYLYPKKHNLHINNGEKAFDVMLSIQLK